MLLLTTTTTTASTIVVLQGGIEKLSNLKTLLMSNNKVASWSEIDRLGTLPALEDLLLVGNPLYNDYKDNNALADYRIEVGTCES